MADKTADPVVEPGPTATPASPAPDAPVADTNTPEGEYPLPQPKKGWVKGQDGRFHEVDDVDSVMAAYPGQYEVVKAGDVTKNKVGWPSEGQAAA